MTTTMLKRTKNKIVIINHLGYTIKFCSTDKNSSFENYCIKINNNECHIILKDIQKYENNSFFRTNISIVAHEIVHALQFICESRNIDMVAEQEHIGYMMNYIMNEFIGVKYNV
jgi:hypothetical protein